MAGLFTVLRHKKSPPARRAKFEKMLLAKIQLFTAVLGLLNRLLDFRMQLKKA
jgi:hypothetical protein